MSWAKFSLKEIYRGFPEAFNMNLRIEDKSHPITDDDGKVMIDNYGRREYYHTEINGDTIMARILFKYGDLSLAIPVEDLKESIEYWKQANKESFSKLYSLSRADYNPIENFDRKEDVTDTGKHSINSTMHSEGHSESQDETKASAYDSATYDPVSSSKGTGGSTTDSSGGNNGTTSNSRTSHLHGNIGVTTTQQMIREEISIADWNFTDAVASMFAKDFLVGIWY